MEQIEQIRAELRAANDAVLQLADAAADDAWIARPAGGGWSASECVAHLTLTTDAYLPLLNEALASAPGGTTMPGRYRMGFVAWLLAKSLEPPVKGRYRTAPAFVPGGASPRAESVAAFAKGQGALIEWLDRSGDVPLNRVVVASPFAKRMRYNAYAAHRILTSHQRRHIWQAERATRGIP